VYYLQFEMAEVDYEEDEYFNAEGDKQDSSNKIKVKGRGNF